MLESQPEATAYETFKCQQMRNNSMVVVQKAMEEYKSNLEKLNSKAKQDFEDFHQQCEKNRLMDEQEAKNRKDVKRANGEFILSQIKAKQERNRKNLELEHFREIEIKKENEQYEEKMFHHKNTELTSEDTK